MTTATDPRSELVEWDDDRKTLVICGTDVPLSLLWQSLRDGRTIKDFLHAHPAAPAALVRDILRTAGRKLSKWPWDSEEEQRVAYTKALAEGDLRFTSGLVEFLPRVRGGKLLSCPSGNRIDILWACIQDGCTPDEILASYPDVERPEVERIVGVAERLFEKGLVSGETTHLPRQRRADRGEGAS